MPAHPSAQAHRPQQAGNPAAADPGGRKVPRILCVGQAVQDFVFEVASMPERAEKYRALAFTSVGGGPAATAAVTIVRLGGQASLAARLGDDAVARLIAAELESYGVDCRYLRRFADCRSSVSAVLVDQAGERQIVNYLDDALPAAAHWLPDAAQAGIAAVLADTRWPTGAEAILSRARSAGLPAVLDADRPIALDSPLLCAASHVAFSADGLADCTGQPDPAHALAVVARHTTAWLCVTLGAAGVLIHTADGAHHVPAFQVLVKDTLGAGDVWHGAFALSLAEGSDGALAVRFANAAAGLKSERPGGRQGVPTRAEVDALLRQHALDGDEI